VPLFDQFLCVLEFSPAEPKKVLLRQLVDLVPEFHCPVLANVTRRSNLVRVNAASGGCQRAVQESLKPAAASAAMVGSFGAPDSDFTSLA
jgi:hypothetical protein